jgi:hypothetical protein
MKKIIETVAEGGGELGVHMYPYNIQFYYVAGIGEAWFYQQTNRCGPFIGNSIASGHLYFKHLRPNLLPGFKQSLRSLTSFLLLQCYQLRPPII